MARGHQRPMGPFFDRKRIQNSFRGVTTSIKGPNLLPTVVQTRTGRRGVKSSPKTGSGVCNSGRSRILLKNFSGSQKEREASLDHRSIFPKCIHCSQDFHNGIMPESPECYSSRRLGFLSGLDGRLFTRSDSQTLPEVSSLHSSRKGLPISSAPIWTDVQSLCVHSSDAGDCHVPSPSFNHAISILGRLAHKKSELSTSRSGQTFCSATDSISRSADQPGEIRSPVITEFHLHRDGVSYETESCQSSNRQDSGTDSHGFAFCPEERSLCQTVSLPLGQVECSSGLCGVGSTSSQTTPVLAPLTVETTSQFSRPENSNFPGNSSPSVLVVQRTPVTSGSSSQSQRTQAPSILRCKQSGLGRPSRTRGTSVSWCLDSRPVPSTHQFIRDEGNNSSASRSLTSYSRVSGISVNGQFDSGVIHQETRRHTLTEPVFRSVEHPSMVSTTQSCPASETYSRQVQYTGRQTFAHVQAYSDGMDTQSVCSQQSVSVDKLPEHGSLCNTSQSSPSDLRVAHSGHECHGDRRPDYGLEQYPRICVSTISCHSECSRQGQTISVQSSLDCPVLATQSVVSGPVRPVSLTSNNSSHNFRPSRAVEREVSSSKSANACTSRLGVIKRAVRQRNFSRDVATFVANSRRASTRRVYDAKWDVFSAWCKSRKTNPASVTPSVVADFLLFLFQVKKLQVSTIKGYRAMLSNTLKYSSKWDFGSDPIISELIKSFELERPVHRTLFPKWDLSLVLLSLCKAPYEPLSKAPVLYLTMKTAFLLAMASAKRVSELHALSMDRDHLRFSDSDGSLTIRTQPGFFAKNQLPSRSSQSICIPSIPRASASIGFNRKLCPVRAVKCYLERTKTARGNRSRLFIPIKGNHDINKSSVSRWIKFTIKLAYKHIALSSSSLLSFKSHEVRALASSLAYASNIPLNEVINAATWSSQCTFAKHYLRDLSRQQPNISLFDPVVTAQRVVGGPEVPGPSQS